MNARRALERPITLIGLRCVGKTSVGRELARVLELGFVDLDDALTWAAGDGCCAAHAASVAQVVAELGWERFRDLEQRELERALGDGAPRVLATGGGVIEREANRAALRSRSFCVWLKEDLGVLERRLAAGGSARPSLTGADPAAELALVAARREPLYRATAHLELELGGASAAETAARIAHRLRGP